MASAEVAATATPGSSIGPPPGATFFLPRPPCPWAGVAALALAALLALLAAAGTATLASTSILFVHPRVALSSLANAPGATSVGHPARPLAKGPTDNLPSTSVSVFRTSASVPLGAEEPSRPVPRPFPALPAVSRALAAALALGLLWRVWARVFSPASPEAWQLAAASATYTSEDARPRGPPRRVAILVEPSPFTYISGYQNRFQNLIRCLREAGDEVLVITTGPNAPDSYYGAKVVEAPTFRFCLYPELPLSLGLSPRVWRALREFRPEVLHASSPGFMAVAAVAYSRWLQCPLLISYHTHVPKYIDNYFRGCFRPLARGLMWSVLRLVHRRAAVTVTVSEPLAAELQAHRAGRGPVRVWQRGVDSDLFHPKYRSAAMRHRLTGGRPERRLLLQVGRLGPEKNLFFLRDVITRLPADTCLAVVGDGPIRVQLEKHMAGTNTIFTGALTGQALWEAYASGDVFVMPSETETLGFVVMEAMAAAVPVVAVRAGGIPDIIRRPGETGFLFSPGDADEAARYIKALFEDEGFRTRVGAAGREALAPWGWHAATMHLRNEYYVPVIESAAQRRGAPSPAPAL